MEMDVIDFTSCHSWALDSLLNCCQVAELLPVAYSWNVVIFLIGIALVDVHVNCSNLFHYQILLIGLLVILIGFVIFLSPFVDSTRIFFSSFFPRAVWLWNWLENPLTCDLSGFKSRVDRHFLSLNFFRSAFLYAFHLFLHFSRVILWPVVAVHPSVEWIVIKKSNNKKPVEYYAGINILRFFGSLLVLLSFKSTGLCHDLPWMFWRIEL